MIAYCYLSILDYSFFSKSLYLKKIRGKGGRVEYRYFRDIVFLADVNKCKYFLK